MQTEFVRRRCDFCGNTEDYQKDMQMNEGQRITAESWIVLARNYIVQDQIYPVVKHACRDTCAQNIISTGQLALPPEIAEAAKRAN